MGNFIKDFLFDVNAKYRTVKDNLETDRSQRAWNKAGVKAGSGYTANTRQAEEILNEALEPLYCRVKQLGTKGGLTTEYVAFYYVDDRPRVYPSKIIKPDVTALIVEALKATGKCVVEFVPEFLDASNVKAKIRMAVGQDEIKLESEKDWKAFEILKKERRLLPLSYFYTD